MAGRRLTKLALSLECTMFHEVKIFDKKGEVKKVLSGKNFHFGVLEFVFKQSVERCKKDAKKRLSPQSKTAK
jgi:hypothetical protein